MDELTIIEWNFELQTTLHQKLHTITKMSDNKNTNDEDIVGLLLVIKY
jgi:hypothetical protein